MILHGKSVRIEELLVIIQSVTKMKIEYKLDRNDFIEHQLFAASKSKIVIKNLKRSRVRLPIVYFILGLVLFVLADTIFALIFIGIGIAWYFIYPHYLKRKYIKLYEKYIDEHFKNRFGKQISLNFGEEFIEIISYMGESKLKTNEITEVNENSNYFFINLSSGESLIIPKTVINQNNEFSEWIVSLVKKLRINHNIDLNWKWR